MKDARNCKRRNSTEDPYPFQPYSRLIINAAITGIVPRKKDTPHVPVTVDEIITDAVKCVSAGASILHLHARDEQENPTHKAEWFAKIIEGIRMHHPEVIICVTTSGRNYNEFEKRSEVLDLEGSVKPDMASLTLGSLNFPEGAAVNEPRMIMKLAEKMKKRGITPELEVFDAGMINTAKYLYRQGYISPPFYFNVILGSIYSVQARMSDLCYLVNTLPQDAVWAAGGIGIFQPTANAAGILMGGHVRVGIEDNIWYDRKKAELTTNVKSILRVRRIAAELGREIASPQEARQMMGLEATAVCSEEAQVGPTAVRTA
jgi:3-keto-5-aminohexanoate cleavage enzyme